MVNSPSLIGSSPATIRNRVDLPQQRIGQLRDVDALIEFDRHQARPAGQPRHSIGAGGMNPRHLGALAQPFDKDVSGALVFAHPGGQGAQAAMQ